MWAMFNWIKLDSTMFPGETTQCVSAGFACVAILFSTTPVGGRTHNQELRLQSRSQDDPYLAAQALHGLAIHTKTTHPWADLQLPELSPPIECITPGNDGSICQNSSKGIMCGLYLPHMPELISDCWNVTAIARRTPGNHGPICQDRRQKPEMWPESAAHLWADLELPNCHRHGLQSPR